MSVYKQPVEDYRVTIDCSRSLSSSETITTILATAIGNSDGTATTAAISSYSHNNAQQIQVEITGGADGDVLKIEVDIQTSVQPRIQVEAWLPVIEI